MKCVKMQIKYLHLVVFDFMKKICCFAGHSKLSNTGVLYDKLTENIERLIIEENVSEFWVGNYGDFDRLCAKTVRCLKEKYDIQLNLVIPYLTSEINKNKEFYYMNYDCILIADIPENAPKNLCILKCNEYMVKNSDFIICLVKYNWGGAFKTLEYAKNKKIKIINME